MRSLLLTALLNLVLSEVAHSQETNLTPIRWPMPRPTGASQDSLKSSGIDTSTFANRSFEAYRKALAEAKFTIILFRNSPNRFADDLASRLDDPAVAKYSDRIVVSITDASVDEGARQLTEALKVDGWPTMLVLRTHAEKLEVVGRIIGDHSADAVAKVLAEATKIPIQRVPIDTKTHWNRFGNGFKAAMRNDRHLLVYLADDDNDRTRKMVAKLQGSVLAKYSGELVCVVTNPKDDAKAQECVEYLKTVRPPTLVLLRLHRDDVDVNGGTLPGEPKVAAIGRLIERALDNKASRHLVKATD